VRRIAIIVVSASLLAVSASQEGVAAATRSCGTVAAPGYHAFSVKARGITCKTARRILKRWLDAGAIPAGGPRGWHCRRSFVSPWRCKRRDAVITFVFHAVTSAVPSGAHARQPDYFRPCVPEGKPPPFTNYYLGQSYESFPLSNTIFFCAPPYSGSTGPPGRDHAIDFVYGICGLPGHGAHCIPQVDVKNAPACDDNYFLFRFARPGSKTIPALTTLRGAPALVIGGSDPRINIYTGDATVTLYGLDANQLQRAVTALRPGPQSSGGAAEGAPLPPPIAGAMNGSLRCGLEFSHVAVTHPRGKRVVLEVRLPRAARVTGWIKPRRSGKERSPIGLNFRAKRGTTRQRLRLRAGRYRVEMMAEDDRGRHTPVRVVNALVP
jgi:hypothetical protein